jgi:hypothetical protein
MFVKLYRLMCDGCGTQTPPYPTSKAARVGAIQAYGWKRTVKRGDEPAKDLCPKCVARAA